MIKLTEAREAQRKKAGRCERLSVAAMVAELNVRADQDAALRRQVASHADTGGFLPSLESFRCHDSPAE